MEASTCQPSAMVETILFMRTSVFAIPSVPQRLSSSTRVILFHAHWLQLQLDAAGRRAEITDRVVRDLGDELPTCPKGFFRALASRPSTRGSWCDREDSNL